MRRFITSRSNWCHIWPITKHDDSQCDRRRCSSSDRWNETKRRNLSLFLLAAYDYLPFQWMGTRICGTIGRTTKKAEWKKWYEPPKRKHCEAREGGLQENPSSLNEVNFGEEMALKQEHIHMGKRDSIEREKKKKRQTKKRANGNTFFRKATEIWHNTERRGWRWPSENNCCFVNILMVLLLWGMAVVMRVPCVRRQRSNAPYYNPSFRTLSAHFDAYVTVSRFSLYIFVPM